MCQYKSICNPIIELTTLLQSCGFTIEKQELKDWHFNEFEIVMKGKKLQLPMIDNIATIYIVANVIGLL